MSNYPESLIYFMWPYQVYFRFSCQFNAESLFNQVDPNLQPNVFVIGFLKSERVDRRPVCIDPEQIDYQLTEFDDIHNKAKEHYEKHKARNIFYSGQGQQEKMDLRLGSETFKSALEEILNTSPNNKGNLCFVSKAAQIDDFDVFVVLRLKRSVYESHQHLKISHGDRDLSINRSFLETLVQEYLKDCTIALYYPNPGENLGGDGRTTEETWRAAAKNFMYTISAKGKDFYGLHGLFEACNKLSTERYEGSENIGTLIIAEKDDPNIELITPLEEPFSFRDYRKVRKLLQLSNDELGMVCNTNKVFGLGKIKQDYDVASESVFKVKFLGIHCWDVLHHNQPILQMRYGLADFPSERITKEKFVSDASRVFSSLTRQNAEKLFSLAKSITTQARGALLIISDNAEAEAARLKNQCFPVTPIKATEEVLLNLSSIDGGVLIDQDGLIWAYGVILDGIVGEHGNSSRGSRYNSAITYHEYKSTTDGLMIIIVSEDGSIDVLPTLRPQIKHSDITNMIAVLEKLEIDGQEGGKTFNELMEWFKNNSFYLTTEEVAHINELKKTIDEKIPIRNVKIMHDDFVANPAMNNSFYLSED
ncbi:hypothetical protein [Sphingobacterium spiritivorum]|uniref:hypothetical protein n=1 Tax=Sphingobacterium spiritivorum TaxID=258 RepID=UPI003DA6BDC1